MKISNPPFFVSIVLPVFNAQPHLKCAIDSILFQIFDNFELIILEDGSTDDSLHYLMGLNDPRIRLLHDGLNRGLSYRLNQGVVESKGKYICRMDADDIALRDRLKLQTDFLESHPEIDLVGGRAVAFSKLVGILGCLPFAHTHEHLCAHPWNRIPLPHPTWMGRREWFISHPYRFPEVIRAEDQDLLLQAYPTSRYHCIDDVVIAYRVGRYSLKSSLAARYYLLKAQSFTFLKRQQYGYLAMSFFVFFAKSFLDLARCIPLIDRFVAGQKITPLTLERRESIENLIGQP
jgi:glycosyltransferase involved in cell wall biosynthesis